jgi:hypothetical protein
MGVAAFPIATLTRAVIGDMPEVPESPVERRSSGFQRVRVLRVVAGGASNEPRDITFNRSFNWPNVDVPTCWHPSELQAPSATVWRSEPKVSDVIGTSLADKHLAHQQPCDLGNRVFG